jgi:arylsulfatase A-like enzyme
MAAEGIRFTQVYAGSTVCAPSRCALMTGLHTGHARIRGNRANIMQEWCGAVGCPAHGSAGWCMNRPAPPIR